MALEDVALDALQNGLILSRVQIVTQCIHVVFAPRRYS